MTWTDKTQDAETWAEIVPQAAGVCFAPRIFAARPVFAVARTWIEQDRDAETWAEVT